MNFCNDWLSFCKRVLGLEQIDLGTCNASQVESYFSNAAVVADQFRSSTKESRMKITCFHAAVQFEHVVMEECSNGIKNFNETLADGKDYAPDIIASKFRKGKSCCDESEASERVIMIGRLPTGVEAGPNNAFIHGHWLYTVNQNGDLMSVQPNPHSPPGPDSIAPSVLPRAVLYNPVRTPVVPYLVEGQEPVLLQHALPVWRAMPLRTLWVLVLKSKATQLLGNDLAYVHEVGNELVDILQVTPKRQIAFGVLTNLKRCVFVAVKAMENHQFKSCHSQEIQRDALPRELAAFVSTSASAFGMGDLQPVAHFSPTECLGSGSTAVVMAGVFHGHLLHHSSKNIVVKTSREPGPLQLERWMIAYLLACGVDAAGIPQVNPEAQSVLSVDYQQCCTAFRRRFGRILYSFACFSQYNHSHFFSYRRFVKVHITEPRLLEIWAILCALHAARVAHCDIRAPNMMYDEVTQRYAHMYHISVRCTSSLCERAKFLQLLYAFANQPLQFFSGEQHGSDRFQWCANYA